MSEPQYTEAVPKRKMQLWKKLLLGVVAAAVLVFVGIRIYIALNPAAKTAQQDLDAAQKAAEQAAAASVAPGATVASADPTAGTAATSASGATSVSTSSAAGASTTAPSAVLDGTWNVESTTDVSKLYVGYRVDEVLAGQNVTATGRTASVTGSLTVAGTRVPTAEFTAQMATVKSDKDQRDGQYNGRIMETAKYPTATFKLTTPIDFKTVPTGTAKITASATGDLTLHGVTKSVTFDISGFVSGNTMTIAGSIPITFADYSITNPSFGPVTTEDHGALEFLLVLDKS